MSVAGEADEITLGKVYANFKFTIRFFSDKTFSGGSRRQYTL